MTTIIRNLILIAVFAISIIGAAAWASNRTADTFRAHEEAAQFEIARLDSIVFSERERVAEATKLIEWTADQISLLRVEAKWLEDRARKNQTLADAADESVVYDEPDSVLVETINTTVDEPNDFIVLCADQYGFTKFCFTRSLTEDYLTMTLTIPALRNSRNSWRELAETHSVLIDTYAEQVGLQTKQNASLNIINVALTGRANEYEDLYHYANRAYKRERFLRHATVAAVVAGAVAFLIVK